MNRTLGVCFLLFLCGCGHYTSGHLDALGADFAASDRQTYSFNGAFESPDEGVVIYAQEGNKATMRYGSNPCKGEGSVTGNVFSYKFEGSLCSGTATDVLSSDGVYIKSEWASLGFTGTIIRKRVGASQVGPGPVASPPTPPAEPGEKVKAVVGLAFDSGSTERKTALVIGNGAYRDAPLANPVHDAQDIAGVLAKLGFRVVFRKNAGLKDMENAIEEFFGHLKNGGIGLFYFAGHGVQVHGVNYLIPVDAEIRSESDVKYKAVDAGRVLGKMEDAGNQLNIVILDACRNNPFARSFRSYTKGLAQMDAPAGSFIAYATSPGSTAADGQGRNGVYTKHLLKNMIEPDLPVEEVFKRVRIGVVEETGKAQIPWEASSLTGNFYFLRP